MNYENTSTKPLNFAIGGVKYAVPGGGVVALPDALTKQIASRGMPLAKTAKEATVKPVEPTGTDAFREYREQCEKFMAAARAKLGIGPTDSVLDAIDDLMGNATADSGEDEPAVVAGMIGALSAPPVVESQPEKKSGRK